MHLHVVVGMDHDDDAHSPGGQLRAWNPPPPLPRPSIIVPVIIAGDAGPFGRPALFHGRAMALCTDFPSDANRSPKL